MSKLNRPFLAPGLVDGAEEDEAADEVEAEKEKRLSVLEAEEGGRERRGDGGDEVMGTAGVVSPRNDDVGGVGTDG
jgi:hypothetical protein